MIPTNSYLIRAFYDYLVDNGLTPHIHVTVTGINGIDVPLDYVQGDAIVLNIAPRSVSGFKIDKDAVSFQARFNGTPTSIYVPIHAVKSIYARETGKGTELPAYVPDEPDRPDLTLSVGKRPTLSIVK